MVPGSTGSHESRPDSWWCDLTSRLADSCRSSNWLPALAYFTQVATGRIVLRVSLSGFSFAVTLAYHPILVHFFERARVDCLRWC